MVVLSWPAGPAPCGGCRVLGAMPVTPERVGPAVAPLSRVEGGQVLSYRRTGVRSEVPAEHGRSVLQPRQGRHFAERFIPCHSRGAAFRERRQRRAGFPGRHSTAEELWGLRSSPGFEKGDSGREGVQALGTVFLKAD